LIEPVNIPTNTSQILITIALAISPIILVYINNDSLNYKNILFYCFWFSCIKRFYFYFSFHKNSKRMQRPKRIIVLAFGLLNGYFIIFVIFHSNFPSFIIISSNTSRSQLGKYSSLSNLYLMQVKNTLWR